MINILVTRQLSGRQIAHARNLNLEPVIEPALEFRFPNYWDEVLKVITNHPQASWIFTSRNGVKSLEALIKAGLQVRPEKSIYAVGAKTQKALRKHGLKSITPHIQTGYSLAKKIIEEQKQEVLHFQGNLSRDEIKNKLTEGGVEVTEVEIYETIIHPVNMPSAPVEAILFYSPSAVEGFAMGEGFDKILPPLFAIGPTTAESLAQKTDQPIITARKPDTKEILRAVNEYLVNEQIKATD